MWEAILTSFLGDLAQRALFKIGRLIVWRRRRGRAFREQRIKNANPVAINTYLKELFLRGSTVDIVSNRLSWVESDPSMLGHILSLSNQGKQFRFHLPSDNDTARRLRSSGQNVRVFLSSLPSLQGEQARFTLINRAIPGSAVLAVGFSDGQDWLITEFTSKEHPQIIAIARGYVEYLENTGQEVTST